jgi:hypothetical protein
MADIEYRRVWMIDGAAQKKATVLARIEDLINQSQPPAIAMKHDTVNMWWRKDSPTLALESKLETTMPLKASVYAQDYGTTLVIGRVVRQPDSMNRFKWMAASAFEYLIDRAIAAIVSQENGQELTERGEKSTDTSG